MIFNLNSETAKIVLDSKMIYKLHIFKFSFNYNQRLKTKKKQKNDNDIRKLSYH